MKVLLIGGNGNISWHCTNEALKHGHEVYVLNREITLSTRRRIPDKAIKLMGDIRDISNIEKLLNTMNFDVVCDFLCFNDTNARNAIKLFKGKTKQYIFISSEAVYKRAAKYLPFKETCPKNEVQSSCDYVAGKIRAEEVFQTAYEKDNFPVTIVRPGYTYDTIVPVSIGQNCFTVVNRYMAGKPVLIAGEGNNLWTFTHSRDFARAFVELIGNPDALGEDFHITTDEWLTWNDATTILLDALGLENREVIHVPFEQVLQTDLAVQKDLIYQKMWHNIYDNSKIRRYTFNTWKAEISLSDGIRETLGWLNEDEVRRRINVDLNRMLDKITNEFCR